MKSKLSILPVLLAALVFALHAVGDEGGENGGGTGVWILPACAFVNSGNVNEAETPRLIISIDDPSQDVKLRVSGQLGSPTATYVDGTTGESQSLVVDGKQVVFPSGLLQVVSSGASEGGTIVIVDAQQNGYVIRVSATEGDEVTFRVE